MVTPIFFWCIFSHIVDLGTRLIVHKVGWLLTIQSYMVLDSTLGWPNKIRFGRQIRDTGICTGLKSPGLVDHTSRLVDQHLQLEISSMDRPGNCLVDEWYTLNFWLYNSCHLGPSSKAFWTSTKLLSRNLQTEEEFKSNGSLSNPPHCQWISTKQSSILMKNLQVT